MYLLFYRLGSKVTTLRGEDEEEADEDLAETDGENPDDGSPTEDLTDSTVHSSLHDTYKDSPFYKVFKASYDSTLKEVEKEERSYEGEALNPLYVPNYSTYLLQHILPFYPLWTRYLQCIILPQKENPLSNTPSEVMHLRSPWMIKPFRR